VPFATPEEDFEGDLIARPRRVAKAYRPLIVGEFGLHHQPERRGWLTAVPIADMPAMAMTAPNLMVALIAWLVRDARGDAPGGPHSQ